MELDDENDDPEELETSDSTDSIDNQVNEGNYILSLYITDNIRQIFNLVILIGSFTSVNISIILMCLAWYISSSVEKHVTFLEDFYSPQAVPVTVGLSGFTMLVASLLGVKVGVGRRIVSEEAVSEAKFMFYFTVSAAATFIVVLVAGITCFVEISTIKSALGDGLLAGMKKYKEGSVFKSEIDSLQMSYKCCGSDNYKDWYKVSWVASKYLDTGNSFIRQSTKEEGYFGKDVPFSCCKLGVMRPCVDTRIEDSSYHSKYQFPDDLTVYSVGCKEAVSDFLGHSIFLGVGLFLFFSFFLWVSLAIMARYLNTSITNESSGDSPIGWLIPYRKSKQGYVPLKEVKFEEPEGEEEEEGEEEDEEEEEEEEESE